MRVDFADVGPEHPRNPPSPSPPGTDPENDDNEYEPLIAGASRLSDPSIMREHIQRGGRVSSMHNVTPVRCQTEVHLRPCDRPTMACHRRMEHNLRPCPLRQGTDGGIQPTDGTGARNQNENGPAHRPQRCRPGDEPWNTNSVYNSTMSRCCARKPNCFALRLYPSHPASASLLRRKQRRMMSTAPPLPPGSVRPGVSLPSGVQPRAGRKCNGAATSHPSPHRRANQAIALRFCRSGL